MRIRVAAAVAVCLAGAGPAFGSDADVFAGYSYTEAKNGSQKQSLNGWQVQASRDFFPHLAIVIDAAGHYGTINASESLSDLSFMAGPRFHIRAGSLTLFAHGLAGWGQRTDKVSAFVNISESTSGFAWAAGGGLSLRLTGHWDARAQADYWSVDAGSPTRPEDDRNVRFAAGVAYRFGH